MDNALSNAIAASGHKTQYDEHSKKILANKQILAFILKSTTKEFSDMDIPFGFV